jgi:mono/diheme cytochrome c family protein
VPYFGLLSQPSKMNPKRLMFMSLWILFAHLVDLYWLIMPTYSKEGIPFGWIELAFPIGWIYILVAVIILGIGIYYIKNLDTINYNESPQTLLRDSIGVYEDKPLVKGGIMPAVDLKLISSPTPELLSKGQEQYSVLCATCHGEKGLGDGVAGAALNPKPRNFMEIEGWTNGREFSGFYKTLQNGIIQNGMAAYEYLPPEERIGIIHYIRSLGEFPEITQNEVAKLDAEYNLSAGIEQPNQIPVKLAIEKLSSETEKLNQQ